MGSVSRKSYIVTGAGGRMGRETALQLDRMGTPAELADSITWLQSDQSSFVTGVELPVGDGMTTG